MTARGWVDLPEPERQLIADAEVLIGGRRHLDQVDQRLGQQRLTWPSPLRAKLPEMLAGLNGRRVVALASGDPTLSGIGTTLVDLLGSDAVRIHPAVSSARWPALGWAGPPRSPTSSPWSAATWIRSAAGWLRASGC